MCVNINCNLYMVDVKIFCMEAYLCFLGNKMFMCICPCFNIVFYKKTWYAVTQAVANGPIIEPVIFCNLIFFFIYFSAGPIIEKIILIFAFFLIQSRHKRF